jgi:hypothetical protein
MWRLYRGISLAKHTDIRKSGSAANRTDWYPQEDGARRQMVHLFSRMILFKSRRDQLLSATLHPPRVFACSLYRYANLYKLHYSIFFMSQFLFELCLRALDAAVAAMSTSYLALLVAVLFALGSFFYQHRGEGWKNVRGNLFRALSYGAVFWFSWWGLLFGYYLFYKIPHEINQTSRHILSPPPKIFSISLPSPPFHRVQIPILPSFVLVSPGPLVNFDSWDFIIAHKGNDKVESIDLQFIDLDKLNNIRKPRHPRTPTGIQFFCT